MEKLSYEEGMVKLKEFTTTRPALPEMLKEVLQNEMKNGTVTK